MTFLMKSDDIDDYEGTTANSTNTEVPAGIYTIEEVNYSDNCINKATGKPMTFASDWGHKLYLQLSTTQGVTIPLGFDYNQLVYLVQAYTGKAGELLPPVPSVDNVQELEAYIFKAVQLCNSSNKKPTITIKGGKKAYLNSISGAILPEDDYIFLLKDITTRDKVTKKPSTIAHVIYPEKRQFNAKFIIVSDGYKEKNGWSGAFFNASFLPYSLEETVNIEDGEVSTDWCRYRSGDKKGQLTPNAKKNKRFFGACAPSMFNNPLEIEETGNLLPEFLDLALKDKQEIKARITVYKIYNNFDMGTITAVPKKNLSKPKTAAPQVQNTTSEKPHLEILRDIINLIEGELVFKLDVFSIFPTKYAPKQSEAIGRYAAPLKESLSTNIPTKFTRNDVNIIVGNLININPSYPNIKGVSMLIDKLEREAISSKPAPSPLEDNEIPF